MFNGHLIEEHREDALLHLAGVLGAEDDHLALGKVDGDRGGRGHTDRISIGRKGAGVVDDIVRMEVGQLVGRGPDEHVAHEEGMVGPRADDTHVDAIMFVPAGEAIHDVDAIPGV